MNLESTIITVAVALIAAMPGILSFLNQRRKDAAETEITRKKTHSDITDVSQRAAIDMINSLREQLREAKAELKEARAENDALEDEIDKMRRNIAPGVSGEIGS